MLESDKSLREELIETREDKEYRHAYWDENLNATIATQIKVLREQRDWKQVGLANEAAMKQPMISRYENVNYSSWSISTLKRLAVAFDVILDVRFRSFRDLVDLTENFSREALQVPKFTDDPYFKEEKKEPKKDMKEKVAPEIIPEHIIGRSILSDWVAQYQKKQAEMQNQPSAVEQATKESALTAGESAISKAIIPGGPAKPSRGSLTGYSRAA